MIRFKKILRMYFRVAGFMGLLFAIIAKLMNSTLMLRICRKDCKRPFKLRLPSSDVLTYHQVFIDQEYDFLVGKQPNVIVDAGANIGLSSIYFSNKYPNSKIIAIEPEQSNFVLLKENTAPYANIIPIQAALWHQDEEINLIDPGLGKWGFMTEEQNPAENLHSKVCHTTVAITIDKIMDDHKLRKIDILKLDIEGAEKEVFSNTSSWIKKVDAIIIELHERLKPGCIESFYSGSIGFDKEWRQGERVYMSRGKDLTSAKPSVVQEKTAPVYRKFTLK
jgi:FkbM family methyltransferase